MVSCEVKPELWVKRFQRMKNQLAVDNPSGTTQDTAQKARVIFMETIYGPDVKSIVQELDRKPIIPGPTYKVTPEGLTCFYGGKEISLRELAVDNVKEQTPQNYNPKEESVLSLAQKIILQSPIAEVVFPVYNKDGRIRYLSQWRRKNNLVETAMIDIAQDGQDKTLEEAKMLMGQMAKEKKGRIKTDKDNQEIFILDIQLYSEQKYKVAPLLEEIDLKPVKLDKEIKLAVGLAEAIEKPVSMIQLTNTKASLTTALHSTVVNDRDNFVNPVLSESAFLFSAVEQNLERTVAEPLFVLDLAIQPACATPIMYSVFNTEPVSMFQNLEENSERVEPIAKKELVQPSVLPSVFQPRALIVSEMTKESLATVKTQRAPVFSQRWQTRHAVACPDCHNQQAKILAEKTEQQPIFEKAVKEFNLPLLEIYAKTAPIVAIRVALKPVTKIKEIEVALDLVAERSTAFNLETEPMAVIKSERSVNEKAVLVVDELPVSVKKKVVHGIDQKQDRLFLVENFTVAHDQVTKDQNTQPLQIKKIFWRVKAQELKPTEVSILEFELPKDQNQRLYAFYHFLQKLVKKVVGEDVIRQRKVKVITEEESVALNLELVDEIEYYLQLLRGRKHAQAFAFVN